ncbi:toxin HicA [filamentous cyanobacterium CCT1]|nr:toxin HicA [filamentous cyanobacterium CCT1]PSN77636.1 toxin HicA [filamentous cyanobacterium CCP4]
MPSLPPTTQQDKLLLKILRGKSDASIPFEPLCQLLRWLGFEERIRGSHHIFSKDGVEEILNLQPKQGKAKAYQVKQVRIIVLKYKLGE